VSSILIPLLIMLVGLVGTVLPVVPGLILVWLGALVYGLTEGFGTAGVVTMLILSGIVAVSLVLGVVVPQRTAVGSGATVWGQVGAVVGALVGFFVIPVLGALAGAPLGAFAFEWFHQGDVDAARRATKGLLVGLGWSALINFVLGVAMIAIWVGWVIV